jgi:hypothetical protein
VSAGRLSERGRFLPLYASAQFRPDIVQKLREREDRVEFNLPRMLHDLRVIGERAAYLPAYVIETADSGLLVYTPLAAERDQFYERVAAQAPVLVQLMSAEQGPSPRQIWTEWLAGNPGLGATLSQLPNGVWRATIRPGAFGPGGKLPLTRLGSYELRNRHFLQLWCEDPALRAQAVKTRALAMTATWGLTDEELRPHVAALATQLKIPQPDIADLRC